MPDYCRQIARLLVWGVAGVLLSACGPEEPPDLADRELMTVFATAGDAPTRLDLSAATRTDGTFRLLGKPASATMSDSVITLDHTDAVHEGIRVAVTHPDGESETHVLWNAVQPQDAPSWPLAIADNRRYLVDAEEVPQVWTGASPWGLVLMPDREEAALYLADRAAKEVNAILVRLIDRRFSDRTPRWQNHFRHAPFATELESGPLDFTAPQEKYWRQVDWILREAYRHGIVVLGAPAYVGYKLGEQGWADHMIANGDQRMRQYGRWVARRYAEYPNIVWVMGGDWRTRFEGKDVTSEVDALAEGIKSVDSVHLMTAHSHRDRSALDDYNRPWLDVNSSYGGYRSIHERVRTDYQRRPVFPTFLIEGHYGNEHGMTDSRIRAQMYQALLGGAFGQLYGNAPQWYFSADSVDHFADLRNLDWEDNLDEFGAASLPVIASLAKEFPITGMVPDHEHKVMTAGHGKEGPGYAPLLYGEGLAIAYLPEQREVAINAVVLGRKITATWRRPNDGATAARSVLPAQERVSLTPPGSGDWILLLEDDAAHGAGRE